MINSAKIGVGDLDKAVKEELDSFYGIAVEDLQESALAAAKHAVKQLKANSPKDNGKYAKGWAVKNESTRTGANVIIHNKTRYMLAHLLEHGHPLPQGGRAKAIIHIKPIEDEASSKFETELKRRIESGT